MVRSHVVDRCGELPGAGLAGFEVRRLTDQFTLDVAALPSIDLNDPVETASEPIFLLPGQSTAADARTINLAPYIVDQITFSEKIQIFAGGRFDILDYEDPLTSTSREDQTFSPFLGGTVSALPDLSFYANYGKSFSPPSTRVIGERKPEEGEQFEIGSKKGFGSGRGSIGLAFYQLKRTNIAIPTENGFTAQSGRQRSRGFELDVSIAADPQWLAFFSYAYNVSILTEFSEMIFTGATPPFFVLDRKRRIQGRFLVLPSFR